MNHLHRLYAWLDTWKVPASDDPRVDWLRVLPFLLVHAACLGVIWVGVSWQAVAVCIGLYLLRMFAITAVYHRLLAHRAYAAPRWLTFLGALVANSSGQRGPLWWAAHHRHHHRTSDQHGDSHSPVQDGFWYAQLLWFITPAAFRTRTENLPDWTRYPELVWLDRFDTVAPLALALGCFALGEVLGTGGWQMLVWGFCISTVALAHATFLVNSLAHRWGTRPYATPDASRNNALIALLTLGEGWHNNHHRYQSSARQGFTWWQLDPTWLALRLLAACGLLRDLRPVPVTVLAEARV